MDLSEYEVRFQKDALMNFWSYRVTTPDGRTLIPVFGGLFIDKAKAEADALRRIEIDKQRETVSGSELQDRVTARTT